MLFDRIKAFLFRTLKAAYEQMAGRTAKVYKSLKLAKSPWIVKNN